MRARDRHHQRVAVGGRLGDGVDAEIAACAGPVVDEHLLPEPFAQVLGQRAGENVHSATRGKGHDDAHGAVREALRRDRRGDGPRDSRDPRRVLVYQGRQMAR